MSSGCVLIDGAASDGRYRLPAIIEDLEIRSPGIGVLIPIAQSRFWFPARPFWRQSWATGRGNNIAAVSFPSILTSLHSRESHFAVARKIHAHMPFPRHIVLHKLSVLQDLLRILWKIVKRNGFLAIRRNRRPILKILEVRDSAPLAASDQQAVGKYPTEFVRGL